MYDKCPGSDTPLRGPANFWGGWICIYMQTHTHTMHCCCRYERGERGGWVAAGGSRQTGRGRWVAGCWETLRFALWVGRGRPSGDPPAGQTHKQRTLRRRRLPLPNAPRNEISRWGTPPSL